MLIDFKKIPFMIYFLGPTKNIYKTENQFLRPRLIPTYVEPCVRDIRDKEVDLSDVWCNGGPVINSFIAMNSEGKLKLLNQFSVLKPIICVQN